MTDEEFLELRARATAEFWVDSDYFFFEKFAMRVGIPWVAPTPEVRKKAIEECLSYARKFVERERIP